MQDHFTNTIFYEIELTAKYCKMLGAQTFEKYHAEISTEEYAILDVLSIQGELCQRDLAKLILKDRANTGKLLDTLEKKGFIQRNLAIKNNRPVKFVKITESGLNKKDEVLEKIRPHYMAIKEKIQKRDLYKITNLLAQFREALSESLEITI